MNFYSFIIEQKFLFQNKFYEIIPDTYLAHISTTHKQLNQLSYILLMHKFNCIISHLSYYLHSTLKQAIQVNFPVLSAEIIPINALLKLH